MYDDIVKYIPYGRYNYCPDCARKKGFLKEDY